ncbi:MAG: hypothetical protein ACJATT_000402 [Myxococcota bacterium]
MAVVSLPDVGWKIGVEIELMAPKGASRRDLAERIAANESGEVHPFWHVQSEPSQVPGMPLFHNLTQGFEVQRNGHWRVRCVDDLTLQADVNRTAAPKPGWFRIVSDDLRLLRLIKRHAPATGAIDDALQPVAALFGQQAQLADGGIVRISDEADASVCLGAPLPGERERPCELVTCPMESDQHATLSSWLGHASALGMTVASEAAIHVHCDGSQLRTPAVLQRLARLWLQHASQFRDLVRTNPRCVRLGPWSSPIINALCAPDFAALSWTDAQNRLRPLGLTKYCDLNIANLVLGIRDKPTVEFRVFPGTMDSTRITAFAHLAAALCRAARDNVNRTELLSLPTLDPQARHILTEMP